MAIFDQWAKVEDELLALPSLSDIVNLVLNEALAAADRMIPYGLAMIGTFALIRLVLTGLKIANQAEEPWAALLQDIWLIAVAIYITLNGADLLTMLAESASKLGGLITGREPVDIDSIIASGGAIFAQLLGALGFVETINITISIPTVATAILILVTMLIIAVMVAIAAIELYLGGLLVILFTWCMLWNPLRFLFTSGVSFVVSGTLKMLAYAVILSILREPLNDIHVSVDEHGISMASLLSTLVLGVLTAAIGLRAGAIGTGISRGVVQLSGREPIDGAQRIITALRGDKKSSGGSSGNHGEGGGRMGAAVRSGMKAVFNNSSKTS